tara:strand:- start:773 stop:1405 length:633 start_codon:yes stop_codon:yes gene_type:complete
MPVEPNTGMQLPYKGEPGYEEAKAQFPEVYAMEEQGGAPPAEMPGDEGPADMAAEGDMMQEMPAAPMPEKPYSVNAVKTLIKELNKTLDKLAGQDIPDIEAELPSKGAKLEGSLPPELYMTLIAIAETLRMIGEDFVDKYGFSPEELMTDADLRKVTATLKKMSKDKKLIEAMQAPAPGAEGMEPEMAEEQPSPPGFFDEDEQELAAGMA